MDVKVIRRGTRSLGYGFVEFGDAASASAAVAKHNNTTIEARQINCEIARVRDPNAPAKAPRRRRAPKAEGEAAGQAPAAATDGAAGAEKARRPRRRRGPKTEGGAAGADGAAAASGAREPRAPRAPRAPREVNPADSEPSQVTLFVANLPFSLSDADFKALFAEWHPESGHVVRSYSGRSRGYGFVKFANNTQQVKALAAHDREVEGRPIAVKVAFKKADNVEAAAAAASAQ